MTRLEGNWEYEGGGVDKYIHQDGNLTDEQTYKVPTKEQVFYYIVNLMGGG